MARTFIIAIAVLAATLGGASRAAACTCMAPGPPCEAFWKAEAVFDAFVERIEPATRQETLEDKHVLTFREHLVHLKVVQSWRGVHADALDVVTASDGAACGYDFKRGQRYLVFASRRPVDGRWGVTSCGATRAYDGTGETAAFLASLAGPAAGGRIFGSVTASEPTFVADTPSPQRAIEARVRLFGDGRERAVTSTTGKFEFTGLAAGPYRLELEQPEGFSAYEPVRPVELQSAHACAQADFYLRPAGRIVGRLVGADGQPAKHFAIEVTTPEARAHPAYGLPKLTEYTDENGDLDIRGLPPGRYMVGVNLSDLPSQYRPHARTLYPSEGSEPTIVTLGVGQTYDLGTWKLPPPVPVVNVQGVVVWQDGTPAEGITVGAWDRTGNPVETARAAGTARSGADGRFTIELRRGRVYTFTARGREGRPLTAEAPRLETGDGTVALLRVIVRRAPPG